MCIVKTACAELMMHALGALVDFLFDLLLNERLLLHTQYHANCGLKFSGSK